MPMKPACFTPRVMTRALWSHSKCVDDGHLHFSCQGCSLSLNKIKFFLIRLDRNTASIIKGFWSSPHWECRSRSLIFKKRGHDSFGSWAQICTQNIPLCVVCLFHFVLHLLKAEAELSALKAQAYWEPVYMKAGHFLHNDEMPQRCAHYDCIDYQ